MKNRLVESELFRVDGQTDRHDEVHSRFWQVSEGPEKSIGTFTGGKSRVILRFVSFKIICSMKPKALFPVDGYLSQF